MEGKGRGLIVAAALFSAAVLLAVNGFVTYSRGLFNAALLEMVPDYGALRSKTLVLALVAVLMGVVVYKLLLETKTETVIRISLPLFCFLLALGLISVFNGKDNRWLIFGKGFVLDVASLLNLSLLFAAFMVSRYRKYGLSYLLLIAVVCVVIPCGLYLLGMYSLFRCLALGLTFVLLTVRLSLDGRLSRAWFVGLGVMAVFAAIFMIYAFRTFARDRLELVLSLGQSDPYGTGWQYSQLLNALRQARAFDSSGWSLSVQDGLTVPAWQYFASVSYSFTPAALALRLGWVPMGLVLAAALCLVFSLCRMTALSGNSFSRYFCSAAASLFAAKTALCCFSCFLPFLQNCSLPLSGGASGAMIDLILLAAAMALSRKREEVSGDLLDREAPTRLFLATLSQDMERELTVTEKLLRLLEPLGLSEEEGLEDEEATPEEYALFRRVREEGCVNEGKREELAGELEARVEELQRQIKRLEEDRAAMEKNQAPERERLRGYMAQLARRGERASQPAPPRSLVFISYNHEDLKYVLMLKERLEGRGLNCWYYDRDILANAYPMQIINALRRSKVCVVLLTNRSNVSEHVANETAIAFEMIRAGLTIMPLNLENVQLSENLYYYLCRQEQTIVTSSPPPLEEQLERFAEKVQVVARD